MATDQKVDRPGDPPPLAGVPLISKAHVAAMEATDADAAWIIGGMHTVMIRTVGRRRGREHKVALPVWFDPEGVRVVIGRSPVPITIHPGSSTSPTEMPTRTASFEPSKVLLVGTRRS